MQKVGTWSMAARTRVADLLFSTSSGIGLSCWRFNIGGGLTDQITTPWRAVETFEVAEGQYDWTRQAPERWFLAAAKARGVPQFLAFVNSPPGRMTRTGITYGRPGKDTTNLKPGFEGQFARYLVDVVEHFRMNPEQSERIAFDYLSPINEPNVDWNGKSQEGCRASNSDIKAVLRALDAELRKRKCRTEIAGIEVSGLAPLYAVADKMSKTYGLPTATMWMNLPGTRASPACSSIVSCITTTAPIGSKANWWRTARLRAGSSTSTPDGSRGCRNTA